MNILKVEQVLSLYRIEKKQQIDELTKKFENLQSFKHDFTQKAEFLY